MRDNASMRWSAQACGTALLLAMPALSGCGRQDAAPHRAPAAAATDIDRDPGGIEWQGSADCADCDGIDVRLVLEQLAGRRRSLQAVAGDLERTSPTAANAAAGVISPRRLYGGLHLHYHCLSRGAVRQCVSAAAAPLRR